MNRYQWRLAAGTALLSLALGSPSAWAQDRNRSSQTARQQQAAHDRFDDNDRRSVTEWYDQHQRNPPVGFRAADRLAANIESLFVPGYVIDRPMRAHIHAVPSDLLRRLPAPPRGDRYAIVDGHVVLIDRGYRVVDVIHVGHGR
jgi:Ni/Co efflux regulator RcnB